MRSLLCLFAALAVCSAADLRTRIRTAIASSPVARQAFWGIQVTDARTGAVLIAENASRFFVPASNTKLFTTALALTRLGPEHRFTTRIEADASPDDQGRVSELRLIGGGDPNLSARIVPYAQGRTRSNPLAVIESLADAVVAKGVRTVEGDITGDDTAFVWEPYPDGWAIDDPVWEYGAPVSALALNDNAFTLRVEPSSTLDAPALLSVWPAVEYMTIHNRTRTVASGPTKVSLQRLPGSRELLISGVVSWTHCPDPMLLAVEDPALYAAMALRDALLARGVRMSGGVKAVHRLSEEDVPEWQGVELASHHSAPLGELIQVVNKVSQNLHAEILLRSVGRPALDEFLAEIGVRRGQYRFEDGSGLSRLSLVTPEVINRLLLFMHRSEHRDVWLAALPVGGEDGTLERRFEDQPGAERIRAKTGSLSHVSALSGYALRPNGQTYIFAILVNNYPGPARPVRAVMDRIALMLVEQGGLRPTAR